MKKVLALALWLITTLWITNAATPYPETSCSQFGSNGLSCDQCFNGWTLYTNPISHIWHDNLYDDFKNNSSSTILLYQKENAWHDSWETLQPWMVWQTSTNWGTSFAPWYVTTTAWDNVYKIWANSSMRWLQWSQWRGFYLESVSNADPSQPGYKYTFNATYRSWDWTTLSQPQTHKECVFVYWAWCWDWKVTDWEKCDPKAPGYTPETCSPVTCTPQAATYKCDSISANPTPTATTTFLPNQQVTFTCNGTNVEQWKLVVKQNWTAIETKWPQADNKFVVNFPNAWSYSAQCIAINSKWNPTESTGTQCELPLTITPPAPEKTYECKNIQITNKTLTTPWNIDFTCYGSWDWITSFRWVVRNTVTNTVVYEATANWATQVAFRATGLTAGSYQTTCYVNWAKGEKTSPLCQDSTITVTPPANPLACVQITVPTQKLPTSSTANITCQWTGDNIAYYTLRVTGPNGFDKTYRKDTNSTSTVFTTDALADWTYSAVCNVSNWATIVTSPACNASNQIIVWPNAPICQDLTVSKWTANPNETITFTCNGSGDISKIKNYVIVVNWETIWNGWAWQASFSAQKTFSKGWIYSATCTVYDQNNTPYNNSTCSNKTVDIAGFDLSIKKYVNEATTANSKEDAQDWNPYQVEVNKPYTYKVVVKNEWTITTFGETKVVDSEIQAWIKITGTPTWDGWTCTNTENSFTCTSNATIAAGQSFPTINIPAVATVVSSNLRNLAYVTNPNEKTPLDYPNDWKNKDEANVRTVDSGFDISLKKYISYNWVVYDAEDFGSQDTDTSVNTSTPVQLPALNTSFEYIIRVKNTGPQTTKDTTTIIDRLDQNVELQSINGNGWNCNIDTDKKWFKCEINRNDITAWNFYPEIKVSAKVTGYWTTRNSATATNPNDKTPWNNTDEGNSNTPNSEFFLKIKKYVDRVSPENDAENQSTAIQKQVWEAFNYILVVRNEGPAASRDVTTITDSATDWVEFTFQNWYTNNGWTCNLTTKQSFVCTRSDSIAAWTNYPELVIPAKVTKQVDYIYNKATVSNPSDHWDNNPAVIKTPTNPWGWGGGWSNICRYNTTISEKNWNKYKVICNVDSSYNVVSAQVDCGFWWTSQIINANPIWWNRYQATCTYPWSNIFVAKPNCIINNEKRAECAATEFSSQEVTYPSCRQIDPPSVKLWEKLPVWWALSWYNLLNDWTFTQQWWKGCEITFFQNENDLPLWSVRVDCRSWIWNTNLMKSFFDIENNKNLYQWWFDVSKTQGWSSWIDTNTSIFKNDKYWEYVVQMTKMYLTKRTYDTNWQPQYQDIVVDLSKNVCQYNFVMVPDYTVQIWTNVSSNDPQIFSKFYRIYRWDYKQIFEWTSILDSIKKSINTTYEWNSINYIFNTFVPNKEKLATLQTTQYNNSKKTQSQEIYVTNGITFANDTTFDKPTTIIVKWTAYIKWNIKGSLMLIADDIIFTADSRNQLTTVEWIYIAKNAIKSENFDNINENWTWSQDWRLIIKWSLIWNTDNLSKNRRPSIDWTNFINPDMKVLQKAMIDWASLRISTNSAIWNSLPPGANEMNEIIQKSRR